jgi:hypothetical protein
MRVKSEQVHGMVQTHSTDLGTGGATDVMRGPTERALATKAGERMSPLQTGAESEGKARTTSEGIRDPLADTK